MSSSVGEYKVLITVVVFLSIFVFLMGLLISDQNFNLWRNQTSIGKIYSYAEVPNYFDLSRLGNQSFRSWDAKNITGIVNSAVTYHFHLSDKTPNDTDIDIIWAISSIGLSYSNNLEFYHMEPKSFWFLTWIEGVQMNPYLVSSNTIVSIEKEGTSIWSAVCTNGDIPTVTVQVTFDSTTYDSLADALGVDIAVF